MLYRPLIIVLILTAPVILLGCEEDLGLRDDYPQPFTLYGLLSPQLDTQSVRLYPIDDFPDLQPADPDGIAFTSTDLNSGDRIVWRDSVVVAPNSQQDVVYWAPFRVEYGHMYRIEAVRMTDGASSYVDVRVPTPASVRFEERVSPEHNLAELLIFVEGERIRALKPEIFYAVFVANPPGRLGTYSFSYEGREVPTERGWSISVNLWTDRLYVQNYYNIEFGAQQGIRPYSFVLNSMAVELIVGDAAWDPPTGLFDPNLLSHQNALNNVVNGLGFVGSGYRLRVEFEPGCELVDDAQYLCKDDVF